MENDDSTELPLPKEFDGRADQRGYRFEVLKRSGDFALLGKFNPNHKYGYFYDVVVIQHNPRIEFPPGVIREAKEAMPSSTAWGKLGWSYSRLQDAEKRFVELVNKSR